MYLCKVIDRLGEFFPHKAFSEQLSHYFSYISQSYNICPSAQTSVSEK